MTTVLRSHHLSAILAAAPEVYGWTEAEFLQVMKAAIQQATLSMVGELAFTFQPQGVSAVLLLEESHVALHFWPEKGKVTVDIHVCDYQQDNLGKAEKLAQALTQKITGQCDRDQWHCLSIDSPE